MQQANKSKIEEIKREIARKVYGVQNIIKQSGTNTWMIKVVSLNHIDDITKDLDSIGFKVMLANPVNNVVYAEQKETSNTFYGRQVKTWIQKERA